MGIYSCMLIEERLDVGAKTVVGIDTVQPVCYTTQLRIEGFTWERHIGYPRIWHTHWHLWFNREMSVPHSCMMGTIISQDRQHLHPTAKKLVVIQAELTSHKVFGCSIMEIAI